MKSIATLTLIIMGLSPLVNAAAPKTINDLIEETRQSGEKTISKSFATADGNVPAGLPGRALEVLSKDTSDDMTHDFIVFLQDGHPFVVIFSAIKNDYHFTHFINLYCDPTGRLNRCHETIGYKDKSGRPIPGSTKDALLHPKSHKASAALRHELDFWLKGKYRKAASKPAAH